jgi:uncharacterized phage-associated protein
MSNFGFKGNIFGFQTKSQSLYICKWTHRLCIIKLKNLLYFATSCTIKMETKILIEDVIMSDIFWKVGIHRFLWNPIQCEKIKID